MKYVLSSIFDRRSKQYSLPQASLNKEVLIRNTKAAINAGGTLLNQFPEDFDLVVLGEFDCDTGVITPNIEILGCLGGDSSVLLKK